MNKWTGLFLPFYKRGQKDWSLNNKWLQTIFKHNKERAGPSSSTEGLTLRKENHTCLPPLPSQTPDSLWKAGRPQSKARHWHPVDLHSLPNSQQIWQQELRGQDFKIWIICVISKMPEELKSILKRGSVRILTNYTNYPYLFHWSPLKAGLNCYFCAPACHWAWHITDSLKKHLPKG